jgi:hypothetical protein
MKVIDQTGWIETEKKTFSFSISYKSLFTMFPQLWISEIKNQRGEKIWGLEY